MVLLLGGQHQEKRGVQIQHHKLAQTGQSLQRGHEAAYLLLEGSDDERSWLGALGRRDLLLHKQYETQVWRIL